MVVTAVIGSYHKGNTYRVVRRIEERMRQRGDVEFRYLFLTEADLRRCTGCFVCIDKGEELCPLRDGLGDIERRLLESDGAVFASPNYACGVTALMKGLIERFAYLGHRPRFFGRYAALVATSAGPVGLKDTLRDLSYFGAGGFTIVSRLGVMAPPFAAGAKAAAREQARINTAADRLFEAIRGKKPPRPSFADMMQFAAFRGIYRSNAAMEELFPADLRYWRERGWLERRVRYYQPAKIGPAKAAFGFVFEKIIGRVSAGMAAPNGPGTAR